MRPTTGRAARQGKRSFLSCALRLGGLLLCGIALGFALLVAAYALPLEPIRENLRASMLTFDGTDGPGEEMNETLARTYANTWLDNSTDLRMMLLAVHASGDPLPRQAAMSMMNYVEGGLNLAEQLKLCLAEELPPEAKEAGYSRYWHGYLVALKPLLLLCTYMDIRVINGLAQAALFLLILLWMQRRGLSRYAPALCVSFVCLTPWVLPMSLQYSTCYYVLTLGMLAELIWKERLQSRFRASAFFMLLGMATSYVDFLTYPVATFGMPFVLWLLLNAQEESRPLNALFTFGAAWLTGYAGMWAGKWAMVALFGAEGEFGRAWNSILAETSGADVSRLGAVLRNLQVFWRKPYKLMGLCLCAAALPALLRSRGRRRFTPPAMALAFALTAALPLAWYYVAAYHSHLHYFFTHRGLCVFVFAALCLVARFTQRNPTDAANEAAAR